jgi:2-phospho-L-lactate guanylyltransferase
VSLHTIVIPVKAIRLAKTRLRGAPSDREALAKAFALDTARVVIDAVGVARVIFVAGDEETSNELLPLGCAVLLEDRTRGADPLNAAIMQGRKWAVKHFPHEPIAVVPSDLPSLTPAALQGFLLKSEAHRLSFCTDMESTGTTIFSAAVPQALRTAYGEHSALAHRTLGAVHIEDVDERARQDVDTIADLAKAQRLGVGPRTAAAMRTYGFDNGPRRGPYLGDCCNWGAMAALSGSLVGAGAGAFRCAGCRGSA